MSKTTLSVLAFIFCGFAAMFFTLIWGVSIYNTEARLKVQYESKLKDNNAQFDNMWKTISQVAQLPEAKKEAYKEIFSSYAQARTSQGQGQMMAWIKENNPSLDLSAYDRVMNVVEAQRATWTSHQTRLVEIAAQYNTNLEVMPRGFVLKLFGFQPIDAKVVTSSRTESAFATGKDDDVQLFQKK